MNSRLRFLLLGLLVLLVVTPRVHAEIDTDAPDFYTADEQATTRTLIAEHIERARDPALLGRSAADLLQGPLRIGLQVVDTATSQPVTDFVVHAFYVVRGRSMTEMSFHEGPQRWASYRYTRELPIGRFESQQVRRADGACVYVNMPAGQYWFQIIAPGYRPQEFSQRIVAGANDHVLVIERQQALRLLLVDGVTSAPLSGVLVKAEPQHSSSEAEPPGIAAQARSAADGLVEFSGLASGRYLLTYPELREAVSKRIDAEGAVGTRETLYLLGTGLDAEFSAQEPAGDPLYVLPETTVQMRDQAVDLGTVPLFQLPRLHLTVRDPAGQPMADMPFEVSYSNSPNPRRGSTGADGTTSFTLFGFTANDTVEISLPSRSLVRIDPALDPPTSTSQVINTKRLQPKPGATTPVMFTYERPPGAIDLRLAFIDARTSQPIADARGVLAEPHSITWRRFEAPDGTADVVEIALSPELRKKERELTEAEANPYDPKLAEGLQRLRTETVLQVIAEAPGFARQVFQVPLPELRRGGVQRLTLAPAATLRGRLMLRPGGPYTSATLRAAMQAAGRDQWQTENEIRSTFRPYSRALVFQNLRVDGSLNPLGVAKFYSNGRCQLLPDGTFASAPVRACAGWELIIHAPGTPLLTRDIIDLRPGVNDLGEICLAPSTGTLRLSARDTDGKPLAGAKLFSPLEPYDCALAKWSCTDDAGQLTIPLATLQRHPEQLLFLEPPWCYESIAENRREDEHSRITFTRELSLAKQADTHVSATLDRGHTLTLRLQPDEASRALTRFYEQPGNWKIDPAGAANPRFRLVGAVIQQVDSPTDGWRYHQGLILKSGLPFDEKPKDLVLSNVPAGRYAVSIHAGEFQDRPRGKFPVYDTGPVAWFPVAYHEILMPAVDHVLSFRVAQATVQVVPHLNDEITSAPFPYPEHVVSLERLEPLSDQMNTEIARELQCVPRATGRALADYKLPLVGAMSDFLRLERGEKPEIASATFVAVPAGRYRVRVYPDSSTMMDPGDTPIWEQQVDVPDSSQTLTLHYTPLPVDIAR